MARSHGETDLSVGCPLATGGRLGDPGLSGQKWLAVLLLGAALALGCLATPASATADAPASSEARSGQPDSSDDPAQGAAASVPKSWQIRYRFSTRWGNVNLLYGNSKYGYRHIKQRRGWSDKGMNRFIRRVFQGGQRICEDPPRCTYLKFSLIRNVTRTRATQDLVVVRNVLHSRAPRRIGIITAYSRRVDFPQGGGGGGGGCTRTCYP